jgi:hypothetical protein
MEWKLFNGEASIYASEDWHKDRDAANHLKQKSHRPRMMQALEYTKEAINLGATTVVDLGCGDGGFLSLLHSCDIQCWGYDITPNNVDFARNVRNVDARLTNFKGNDIVYGDVAILTEVLEHLEDPHGVIKSLPCKYLIASSPFNENDKNHPPYHIWAWDEEGYQKMISDNGYTILKNTTASGWSQIVLAVKTVA